MMQPDNEMAEGEMPMAAPSMEQCVPANLLAMPDDNEQMVEPEVGDIVQYTVEGKISRLDGGNAYLTPTAINGKEVNAPEQQPEGDNMGTLTMAAQKMDESE